MQSDSLWDACSMWHKCFTKWTIHVWCKKMLDRQKFYYIPRCNQSFFSGMDSSQHCSLH